MFPVDTDVNVVALKRVTFSIGMFKREWKNLRRNVQMFTQMSDKVNGEGYIYLLA